jgi:hypothetical protein
MSPAASLKTNLDKCGINYMLDFCQILNLTILVRVQASQPIF